MDIRSGRPIRSTNTSSTSGSLRAAGPAHAVLLLRGGRPGGRAPGILDGGGTVDEIQQFDFGTVLGATDPQGNAFAVFQPTPGQPRPELNGGGPGELSYITYEVTGLGGVQGVLQPGVVLDVRTGPHRRRLAGHADPSDGRRRGRQRRSTVTVPMWTVADIDAAVARVREAGGTVIEEPSQQSYGKSALCTDDQGTRFYLGEL